MLYCDGDSAWDPAVNAREPEYLGDYEAIVDAVFILPVEQEASEDKPVKTVSVTDPKTGITLRISNLLGDVQLQPLMGRL